jgi:multidrug efflux system membrane fusion protein
MNCLPGRPGRGLLLVAMAAMVGCGKQQAAGPPVVPAVPVVVAQVEQKTVPVEIRAIGNVEAYSTVSLKAQVTGQITAIHFREGQDVRKGDLLFEIDRRPFEVALAQAQAALARDKARAENSRIQAERYAKLYQEGVASKEQYDAQRADAESLAAAVQADQAAIDQAKLNLEYCSIHSPVDGRTGSLMLHVGNLTKANDVPILVTINQITPIYVNFAVPEQYLAEVKARMAAGRLMVRAQVPDEPSAAEEGALSFVDNTVDAATGTIKMKATFPNPRRKLWPGQFVNVVLTLSAQPNAIVVPAQAVNTAQNGSYVFVVGREGKAQMRRITPGRTVGNETVITEGLKPGETVVTDGQLRLVDGSRVTIKDAPKAQ